MYPEDIDQRPEQAATTVPLANNQTAHIRPLSAGDRAWLGAYFAGLSQTTRGFYGPHLFDQATADKICDEICHADILRMIATIEEDGRTRIAAYFLLMFGIREDDRGRYEKLGISLDKATDCTLAPSVADDYQNTGVGSLVIAHLVDIFQQCGRKRIVLWGGVQERNARGVHFYKKFGFRKVGEFMAKINNYDMIKAVTSDE